MLTLGRLAPSSTPLSCSRRAVRASPAARPARLVEPYTDRDRGRALRCAAQQAGEPGPSSSTAGEWRPRSVLARSSGAAAEPAPEPAAPSSSLRLQTLLELAWKRVIQPLRDFGFGRRTIWEGGVGLFILGGLSARSLTRRAVPRAHPCSHTPRARSALRRRAGLDT
jgi:hypothetical protein